MPEDFLQYLAADGVVLPACADTDEPVSIFTTTGGNDEISDFDYHCSDEVFVERVDTEEQEGQQTDDAAAAAAATAAATARQSWDFPALDTQLKAAIRELGGSFKIYILLTVLVAPTRLRVQPCLDPRIALISYLFSCPTPDPDNINSYASPWLCSSHRWAG